MLDTLKNKINSIFSKIFLLILAASFALWGVGDIFSSRNNPGVAAVGKLDVTANEFIQTYQRILTELNKNADGQITEEVAQSLGLPRQTLSQLINEKIIDIEVEKANITVPDEHLKKLIYSSSLFKDQFGAFNKQQFQYVLRQLGMDEKIYFNEIKKSILRDQIRSPFAYANDISPVIKETYYNIRNESRSIKVINIAASNYKINDIPKDTEIQNKLNKDQEMYMNQELRSFSFISLKPADLIDTINISEEDLKAEYNNYPEKYNISEKRNVLLVNFQNKEEAIKIIEAINQLPQETNISEKLLTVLKNSPTQDHEEAKLGIIEYKDLPNEVSENVFKARENKLIGPEKTPFGWRIFLVSQIIPEIVKKYLDVKLEIAKELKVNVALEKMYDLGNAFYDEIAAGNGIEDAATAINAKVLKFKNIDANGIDAKGNILNELPPYPNLMQTVFSANINEPSELINTIGNTIYAIQVEDIVPQSTMTFDEAKEKIIKDIQIEKSLNVALNIANEIVKKQNNKQDFESLAKEYNLVLLNADNVQKDGSGAEGILNDEALNQVFIIKNGKTTNPIKYNDNTYIVAKVEDVIPVVEINKEKLLELNLTISNEIANDIQELFIKNLTSKQKIKINDALLDSLFQNNS